MRKRAPLLGDSESAISVADLEPLADTWLDDCEIG